MPHHHTHACADQAFAQAEAYCAAQGLRFTPLRQQVFGIVWRSHKAISAMEVLAALGADAKPPTAYRALEFLQQHGLIHQVASLNAFVGCHMPGSGHTGQLLICRDCRTVTELDVTNLAKKLGQQAAAHGFTVRSNHIELLGTCGACARA
jgi:Fur family zinc uptake transcriptional regulator